MFTLCSRNYFIFRSRFLAAVIHILLENMKHPICKWNGIRCSNWYEMKYEKQVAVTRTTAPAPAEPTAPALTLYASLRGTGNS